MNVYTTTQLRQNIYKIVDEVTESHEPVFIKGKRNDAILISKEDWESIEETLYLTAIPGMAASIKEGLKEKEEECVRLEDTGW